METGAFAFAPGFIQALTSSGSSGGGGTASPEILRPTGNGAGGGGWTANTGALWDAINDSTSDSDTTYISTTWDHDARGFTHTASALTTQTIDSVVVHVVAKYVGTAGTMQPGLYIGTSWYTIDGYNLTSTYADYTNTFTVNPATSAAWTVADINSAQIVTWTLGTPNTSVRVTQCWLEINYQ